ncbi:DUF1810 domain-containing protein [Terrabacter carboxydivorans]|uniref:DUF1810 domain-containing protein n=2 Tax=Terrabacter carboxydivorans TaxID=619730 RepID=A0ABN3M3V0_9MICO
MRRALSRVGYDSVMTENSPDLERFVRAQDAGGTYASALAELRAGSKRSHWMWFVFPQVAGLGRSETARAYAVSGLPEARAYLSHPVLGPRLRECADALTGLATTDPVEVLGAVDAAKLRSSMTLFELAASDAAEAAPFVGVLDHFFGGRRDDATTGILGS